MEKTNRKPSNTLSDVSQWHQSFVTSTQTATQSSKRMQVTTLLVAFFHSFPEKRLHPVASHSRKSNSAERNYHIHDKELLAILIAFLEWKPYLQGTEKPITVYTDHQNLQYFLTSKAWTARQICWSQKLCHFNFVIIYRPGMKGGKPDTLSRRPKYRPEEGAGNHEQQIL